MLVWMLAATFALGIVAETLEVASLTCIFAESGKSNPSVAKMKGSACILCIMTCPLASMMCILRRANFDMNNLMGFWF